MRQFSGLHLDRIPDETTILNFRRLLEKHELAGGILQIINGYLLDRGQTFSIMLNFSRVPEFRFFSVARNRYTQPMGLHWMLSLKHSSGKMREEAMILGALNLAG